MSTPSSALKPLLILYGAGPGLGLSIAKAFQPTHALALLSRSLANLKPLVQELEKLDPGAEVRAYESEATEEGLKKAFEDIKREWKGRRVEVGVWNASVKPSSKPFLETTNEEFEASVQTSILGPSIFARLVLPLLLANPLPTASSSLAGRGTLLFTGATASLRGAARFGVFATGKFGLKALGQSLARELGPEGVHVGHVVVDGRVGPGDENKLDPDSVAKTYLFLHQQDRTSSTFEVEVRPFVEKF